MESNKAGLALQKKRLGLREEHWLLIGILALSIVLHGVNLSAIGTGNAYYAAAVQSMRGSWHNFFFAAAEPGGSVTVDKPPLGLWVQVASVTVFGFNGLALLLPQILAGVLAVWVVYRIARPRFGVWAGLLAALILALSPAALAVNRNNTMDAQLNLVLLLAAWAVLAAAEKERPGWLFLGAFLVGVGFNIKMLQAFLPLPALAAAYVLGSRARGWKKLLHLALAGLILLTVSLAWVAAVDLTPPDRRPYIGSSEDNTVLSLIVGHNGLNRLFGRSWLADAASGPSTGDGPPPSDGAPPSDGGASSADAVRPEGPGPEGNRQNSGGRGPDEIGVPGAFRLFIPPLSNEAAWVLPLALVGAAWLAWLLRGAPGRKGRISLWVWGGWLVTGWVFFSMAGFFHAYYLSLLAGPSAVLGGAALGWMIELVGKDRRRWAVLAGWVVCLFVFQVWVAIPYGLPVFPLAAAAVLAVPAIVLAAGARPRAGAVLLVLVLMILPGFWTLQTALDPGRNVNLPAAWEGPGQEDAPRPPGGERPGWDSRLVPFLTERYAGSGYLVAAPSAMAGADLVLETGLPVLYIGGFNGSDPVAGADDLAGMAAEGSLCFVLWSFASGPGASREVGAWLREACVPVPGFGDGALVLLDCGGNE